MITDMVFYPFSIWQILDFSKLKKFVDKNLD